MIRLNSREIDVLNIMYKTGRPMTATDIVNERRDMIQSTVKNVLRKLLSNNMVEVSGYTYNGNVLSRIYLPTEKSKKIIMDIFIGKYANFINIISKSDLCAVILSIEQNTDHMKSEIYKLKKIIEDYEKKI